MLHIIFLTILFYSITSLASFTPTQFPPKRDGFTASLIPPISPHSPFYPEILAANNISSTLTNVTLDRSHYDKWVETKRNISKNEYGIMTYNREAYAYVMHLVLGDPIQTLFGIFDTASEIVWVPCNNMAGKTKFPYFHQNWSLKYKEIDCRNKKQCRTGYTADVKCSPIHGVNACLYSVGYVDGDFSKGVMASDMITLEPDNVFLNFMFGCSNENPERTPGVIGAGNSIYSLPRQLFPNNPRFSYCFSGSNAVNIVRFGSDAQLLGNKVKVFRHGLDPYYYIDVVGITVNGINLKLDPSVFALSSDGRTGFVIDSGCEDTSLTKVAYDALINSLYKILGASVPYAGHEHCYKFGTFWRRKPVIGITFRGWVLELDQSNVWGKMRHADLECLLLQRSPASIDKLSVLGEHQLFDVNVGHDIKNNFVYLKPMNCPTAPTAF